MNTATMTTFEVSEVKRATEPLSEVPYKEAVEALITPGKSQDIRLIIKGKRNPCLPQDLPKAPALRPVEACSRYYGRLLEAVAYHPVVAVVHRAFIDHRPLCLSPDTIWLMIIQGVANHINANAEELRPRFVNDQGQVKSEVRRDDFVKGSPENPWSEVFNEFSAQIRDHVGAKIDSFLPAFSTTGPVERAAAEVVLLDAMQSYFEYQAIPAVESQPSPWMGHTRTGKALSVRAQGFRDFGLGTWIDVLSPILDQFAHRQPREMLTEYSGDHFTNSIARAVLSNHGLDHCIFPIPERLPNQASHRAIPNSQRKPQGRSGGDAFIRQVSPKRGGLPVPTTQCLPSGLSKAPFRWHYLDRPFDMEFLGGFLGVAQDQETLTLRPEVGWAARDAPVAGSSVNQLPCCCSAFILPSPQALSCPVLASRGSGRMSSPAKAGCT